MGMTRRILILPHVGTAYGHLIRLARFVGERYFDEEAELFFVIPSHAQEMASRFIDTRRAHSVFCNSSFSITSETGRIDLRALRKVHHDNLAICQGVAPDLILGSPGIAAGILGQLTNTAWEAVTHGLYLPLPSFIESDRENVGSLGHFAYRVWCVARQAIDCIVRTTTGDRCYSWENLQTRGKTTVLSYDEGVTRSLNCPPVNTEGFEQWKDGPADLLITRCSGGRTPPPPESFLRKAARVFDKVVVSGDPIGDPIAGIQFVGNRYAYESLVGENTTVISHGGHGTIRSVRSAKTVILIPGDLDQLYNSICAHQALGYRLVISKSWVTRLSSSSPFRRIVDWDVIDLDTSSGAFIEYGLRLGSPAHLAMCL